MGVWGSPQTVSGCAQGAAGTVAALSGRIERISDAAVMLDATANHPLGQLMPETRSTTFYLIAVGLSRASGRTCNINVVSMTLIYYLNLIFDPMNHYI